MGDTGIESSTLSRRAAAALVGMAARTRVHTHGLPRATLQCNTHGSLVWHLWMCCAPPRQWCLWVGWDCSLSLGGRITMKGHTQRDLLLSKKYQHVFQTVCVLGWCGLWQVALVHHHLPRSVAPTKFLKIVYFEFMFQTRIKYRLYKYKL